MTMTSTRRRARTSTPTSSCAARSPAPSTAACWSKSSTGKLYPYTLCHTAGCPSRRKSIPLDRIQGEFDALLRSLEPAPGLSALVKAMFRIAWDQRTAQAASVAEAHRKEMDGLNAQLDKLMARIVETDSPAVITAYERKIAALENRKLVVAEQLAGGAKPRYAFEELFERAQAFLSSPRKIWSSGDFAMRRLVLRLAFAERIPYRCGEVFSNVRFALPFNILKEIDVGANELARPKGFEPLTPRFVVWCSIQLSYGRPSCRWGCRPPVRIGLLEARYRVGKAARDEPPAIAPESAAGAFWGRSI